MKIWDSVYICIETKAQVAGVLQAEIVETTETETEMETETGMKSRFHYLWLQAVKDFALQALRS